MKHLKHLDISKEKKLLKHPNWNFEKFQKATAHLEAQFASEQQVKVSYLAKFAIQMFAIQIPTVILWAILKLVLISLVFSSLYLPLLLLSTNFISWQSLRENS